MTVRELIIALLDYNMDAIVRFSAGEDPKANLTVTKVVEGNSYVPRTNFLVKGPVIR